MERAETAAAAPTAAASTDLPPVPKDELDVNATSRASNLKFPVPSFYEEDPERWFWQLEAHFIINKVTKDTEKYAVAVANLPYKVVRRIPTTLINQKDPYKAVKELVVKETDLSNYQRSEKLHSLPALGDQRPSELLASIRNLQPVTDCKCYCSRFQFLSRMPPITRSHLVNHEELTVDELAALADTIMLSQAALSVDIHHVKPEKPTASSPTVPTKKEKQQKKKTTGPCWFHAKYGEDAKSCRDPCSWKSGNGHRGGSRA